MSKLNDLIGMKFNKLLVTKRVENYEGNSDSRTRYECLCDCGKKELVVARYLKRGDKKACVNCSVKSYQTSSPLKDARAYISDLEKELQKEREKFERILEFIYDNPYDPTAAQKQHQTEIEYLEAQLKYCIERSEKIEKFIENQESGS